MAGLLDYENETNPLNMMLVLGGLGMMGAQNPAQGFGQGAAQGLLNYQQGQDKRRELAILREKMRMQAAEAERQNRLTDAQIENYQADNEMNKQLMGYKINKLNNPELPNGVQEALWAAGGDEGKARELLGQWKQNPYQALNYQLAIQGNARANQNLEMDRQRLSIAEDAAKRQAEREPIQDKLKQMELELKQRELDKGPNLTEGQGKAVIFGDRADAADKIIGDIGVDYSPIALSGAKSVENMPLVGHAANALLNDKTQKAMQAQRDFISAVLRLESGAKIDESEFSNAAKQYFPQPGDKPETLAQKAANRRKEIDGLRVLAGPGAKKQTNTQVAPQVEKRQSKVIGGKTYYFDGQDWYAE